MPKVSVIVPVYNVEKYLQRCLISILSQTYSDIEVICVNDGSTDKSAEILKQFEKQDKRLKVVTQKNQGLSMARNNGLKKAKGTYCLFIDSDDAIHPQTVEICMHYVQKEKTDLVCFKFEKSDGGIYNTMPMKTEKIPYKVSKNPLINALSNTRFRIPFSACTKFYKISTIRDIPFIKGIYYEDGPHTYALLAKHPKTVILDASLYFYTQNMASISNQKSSPKQLSDYRTLMLYIDDIYQKSPYTKDLKKVRYFLYPKLLNNQLKCYKRATDENKEAMKIVFAESLREYQQRKMISLCGCGLLKYLKYLSFIKK